MSTTPTSILVTVDREEYCRFEEERRTILVTITPSGSDLYGEQITVELRKNRRARDEIVATKTLTLSDSLSKAYQVEFYLPDIVDETGVSKVRRGEYFIQCASVSDTDITASSENFNISLISVDRLKSDYLHGCDRFASTVLTVMEQPKLITGVTVDSISAGHSQSWFPLSYNFSIQAVPNVETTLSQPFALANGKTLILRIDGGSQRIVTFNAIDFVNITAATAAEVAAAINAALPGEVTASVDGTKVKIEGGLLSLLVDPEGTANTALGLLNQSSVAVITRTLSWCSGPSVVIESGRRLYTLRRGTTNEYIQVRISSIASLPTQSHAEELLVNRTPLDAARMRAIINQAISWVENVSLSVYLEPTRLVTEVDPDAISYGVDGTDIPQLVGADWDEVVDALAYTTPGPGHWISFKCPYIPIQRFDELYGKLSNVRIIDIALEWLEPHKLTGWVELVPFNQEVAFNFIGLVWVESLRGPVPLPNFWNFNLLVGYDPTPPVLLELVAKKAAIDILTIAGQAFRPGFSGQSISRDGVSESVSYVQSGQAGIFGASITEYRTWISDNLVQLRGAFRGPNLIVV